MLGNHLLGPFVVFDCADNELDFVDALQETDVFPAVAGDFAAAGALQVHDSMNAPINRFEVVGAAGFEQNGKARITQPFHQWNGVGLQERFAARQFDQWQTRSGFGLCERLGQPENLGLYFRQRHAMPFAESIGSVAIRTAQVAGRQPDEHAGKTREGAFALLTHVNLINEQGR